MKTILFVILAGLWLTAGAVSVTAAAAPAQKIVITPASFSEREGLLIVSQNQGFFRKYKLDVQLVLMPSAPIAFSALTAGESHFYYGTTSGTSLGAVLNGLDGVFVAGFINKLVGAFAVSKDIKTPNDLKGKQIGVASLGGGNWMFTMLAFDHWGLDPKRDNITFRIIGNTGVRAQSIAFDHWGLDPKRDNITFRIIGNTGVRALLDGITFIQNPENKSAVLKSLVQWLRLSKTEDAVEGYEFMRKMYTKRIYPTIDGIRNSLRVLATTNEKFRALKAEDLVDDRIVRKLEKEGAF